MGFNGTPLKNWTGWMGFNVIGLEYLMGSTEADPIESHWILLKQWDPIEIPFKVPMGLNGIQWDFFPGIA